MTTLSPPPVSFFSNDLEPITYPAHLAQVEPPDPAAVSPGLNVRPSIRHRDLTMGSGATILLGAVHTPPARLESGLGGPPIGVPKRKDSISGVHDREGTPTEDGGRSYGRANNLVSYQGNGEESTVSYAAPEASMSNERVGSRTYKDGEIDSGGEATSQRRRATTRPSASASQVVGSEIRGETSVKHERERSRKSSAKQPRTAIRRTEPLLPSAKGVPRAPASAMYFSPLPSHGRPPGQALRAHTGTLVGDRIWFLGGVDGRTCWRSVAWLDTESLLWSTVDTNGEQLPPLRAHTTTLVGERLYIFGGGDGPTYSNDVWIFNTGKQPIAIGLLSISDSSLYPRDDRYISLVVTSATTRAYDGRLSQFSGGIRRW